MNFRTNNMQNLFLFNILNLCKLITEVRHLYSKSLVVRLRHKPVEEASQDAGNILCALSASTQMPSFGKTVPSNTVSTVCSLSKRVLFLQSRHCFHEYVNFLKGN